MSEILEGTGEFNRQHQLNGANLDPVEPGELYKAWQSFIRDDAPRFHRTEVQGEYIEEEWEQELDEYSQEYHAFQQILPDTQEGFDGEGDYHAIPTAKTAYEGLGQAITPYRWASYLEDALQQYISTMDYTFGRSERWDIVQDIVSERMERAANMEERYALEDALQVWYRSYGGGNGN